MYIDVYVYIYRMLDTSDARNIPFLLENISIFCRMIREGISYSKFTGRNVMHPSNRQVFNEEQLPSYSLTTLPPTLRADRVSDSRAVQDKVEREEGLSGDGRHRHRFLNLARYVYVHVRFI